MSAVRELATGRWGGLLGQWLDDRMLAGKPGPCPLCKTGKDRFRWDDLNGAGTYYCNACGSGDGFMFLQEINSWTFAEAANYVERECGKHKAQPAKPGRSIDDVRESLRRVWSGGRRIQAGDPVWQYLERRCGITEAPGGLRYHPALPYVDADGVITEHPAMLAQVLGADGQPVSIHRTYITADGQKAAVCSARKTMTPTKKLENVAVRLVPVADGWLGVAEGIETALCAAKRYGGGVWSCLNAQLLKSFRPPPGVVLLAVYGDNDKSFTGQAAAFELARAVTNLGVECKVLIPEITGTDWADATQPPLGRPIGTGEPT